MVGGVRVRVRLQREFDAPASKRGARSSGGGSASEPGGCGGVLLLIIGAIVVGAFAGGDDTKRPSTPPESLSQPQSRVAEPYAPAPRFEDYDFNTSGGLPPRPDVVESAPISYDIRDQRRNGRDR